MILNKAEHKHPDCRVFMFYSIVTFLLKKSLNFFLVSMVFYPDIG